MSVNLLKRPSKPVTISDELESFFHVLLYYCVRYLRSNCECPTSFIENYFENYAGPRGINICGWKSLTIEEDDFLSCQWPPRPLLFDSPMDGVMDTILKCLQSLYKVRKDDARKARPPPPKPVLPKTSDERLAPIRMPVIRWFGKDANREKVKIPPVPPPEEGPSAKEREQAKRVMDHQFMIEHLTRSLRSPKWPDDDRTLSPAVEPHTTVSRSPNQSVTKSASRSTFVSNKRRRICGPERNVSLPPRLHASTRRTRLRPCTLPIRVR